MRITVNTSPENEDFLRKALVNAGIPVITEQKTKLEDPINFSIPESIGSLSVLLHVIESDPSAFTGQLRLQDGQIFTLDENGRSQLRDLLSKAMRQPQPSMQQAPAWWMYFVPQIGNIINEIAGLVKWYPRALGEGQTKVTKAFIAIILVIIGVVAILTFLGRVSGDAFIFVVGILLGYLFAFLSKFLGLTGGGGE